MRTCFYLFVVLLCGLIGKAQRTSYIGIDGGAGITSLRGNAILFSSGSPALGIGAGLSYHYTFNDILSIRMGFGLERKGVQNQYTYFNVNGSSYVSSIASNFDYLVLPLLLKLTLGQQIRFFANAGPFAAYLLREQDVSPYGWNNSNSMKVNATANFKPFDFGLCLGFGLSVPVTEAMFVTAEFRGNLGFNNISRLEVYGGGSIKTSSSLVLIGLVHRIGKNNQH